MPINMQVSGAASQFAQRSSARVLATASGVLAMAGTCLASTVTDMEVRGGFGGWQGMVAAALVTVVFTALGWPALAHIVARRFTWRVVLVLVLMVCVDVAVGLLLFQPSGFPCYTLEEGPLAVGWLVARNILFVVVPQVVILTCIGPLGVVAAVGRLRVLFLILSVLSVNYGLAFGVYTVFQVHVFA
jgi:hypothetical protein